MYTVPRPKGSKNKKSLVVVDIVENLDDKIAAVEADITKLNEDLKARKAELKKLSKAKVEAARVAAEKQVEADKAKLLEVISASGKSINEVIDMLKPE